MNKLISISVYYAAIIGKSSKRKKKTQCKQLDVVACFSCLGRSINTAMRREMAVKIQKCIVVGCIHNSEFCT